MKTILDQYISWDEKTNACNKVTKWSDESISVEPMTSEEAALWQAQHKY